MRIVEGSLLIEPGDSRDVRLLQCWPFIKDDLFSLIKDKDNWILSQLNWATETEPNSVLRTCLLREFLNDWQEAGLL
jgi:hypothetical protein